MAECLEDHILYMQMDAFTELLRRHLASNFNGAQISAKQFGFAAIGLLDGLQDGSTELDPTSSLAVLQRLSEEARGNLEKQMGRIALFVIGDESFARVAARVVENHAFFRRSSMPDLASLFQVE